MITTNQKLIESTNYSNLTIAQILALAGSDNLDNMQLAARLSKRLLLDVRRHTAALNDAQTKELANLELVTDRDFAGGAR
jgi:hypothetical protein